MKFIRILLFLCIGTQAVGQNLLGNPGFELYSQCPVYQSQIRFCAQWDSAIGTADFYTCGYYAPSTIGPYGIPASGNGCIGLVASPPYTLNPTYWYGEAISTDLPSTLVPGEKFELKIDAMINPMGGPCPSIDCYSLGFLFVKKSNQISFPVFGCSNANPQIKIGINELQSGNYQTFTRSFIADSCYDRLIIGMFCNGNTSSTACMQIGQMAYIDIDNVSMIKTQNAPTVNEGFAGSNLKICVGDCISFSDTGSSANYKWQWKFEGADNINGSQKTESSICYSTSGTFDVELITTRECRTDTLAKHNYIDVSELPFIEITTDTTPLCTGELKTLFTQSNTPVMWENGEIGSIRIVNKEGLYIAQSNNQCGTISDSILVEYDKCDCNVYLPNSFSPNDDQTNDFYSIYYDCVIESPSLIIANRWGEIIYKSDNIDCKWDGQYKGVACDEGIYVAALKYKGYSNGLLKQFSTKQTVTLIR